VSGFSAGDSGYRGQAKSASGETLRIAALPTGSPDGSVSPDAVLAVLLASDLPVDPARIWVRAKSPTTTADAVDWRPVAAGDPTRVWVTCRPSGQWPAGDIVLVTAGATTVAGRDVGPVAHAFRIETAADTLKAPPAVPVWQPDYADFDSSRLDLATESNAEVALLEVDGAVPLPELTQGLGPVLRIAPEAPFDLPQRVWLPVPYGLTVSDVEVFYYAPAGEEGVWYPSGNVLDWVVPGSHLALELDGVTYLGFLTRHGGLVQLGLHDVPADTGPAAASVLGSPATMADDALLVALLLFAVHFAKRRRRTSQRRSA
jgi:hypothetical protein